jgi:hypothetical protein
MASIWCSDYSCLFDGFFFYTDGMRKDHTACCILNLFMVCTLLAKTSIWRISLIFWQLKKQCFSWVVRDFCVSRIIINL